jgi:pimeloyl-ACP methyl ester carboxylesterase
MNGNPITELRKAAKNFCGQVLEAEGENYVAVITLEGNVFSDFSNDLVALNQAIDTMRGSASDPTSGLNKAKELFELANVPDNLANVVKNIIVMSDGQPGNTTRPTETAQALWPNHKVYSLGFFHRITGTARIRAEEFMRGLQNAGFYGVENADDLDFVFNDIADDIISGNSYPIIFIPGIMGSDLYYYVKETGKTAHLWPPISGLYYNYALAIDYELSVRNIVNLNDSKNERYYGAADMAKKMVDKICTEFPNREVYFFAYDWRKSCSDNADRLEAFINSFSKVDIVAHSMGGLIASSYFMKGEEARSKINKIITIATPYEGAAEAILRAWNDYEMMKMDNILGPLLDGLFSWLGNISPAIKCAYPSMAQISPTSNHHAEFPLQHYIGTVQGKKQYRPFSAEEYDTFLERIFHKNAYGAKQFHESLKNDGYNALLKYDKAYFILATGKYTIASIYDTYDFVYRTDGDGTVPYFSASISERVIGLPEWRWHRFNGSHTGVLSNEGAINWVTGILRQSISDVKSDEYDAKPYDTIRVACPVDVTITSNEGNLSSKADAFNDFSSFGRMDILGENGDIKMFCIDDGAFPVTMKGTGTGTMDYSIRFFDKDNNLKEERNFEGVPITDRTIITTNTSRSGPTLLYIDKDGDGIVDEILTSSPETDPPATQNAITLPVNISGGSVTADKTTAAAGETVTLTIIPASGYALASVSVHKTGDSASVTLSGEDNIRTFTMPSYPVTVTASFISGGGTVDGVLQQIVAPTPVINVPNGTAKTAAGLGLPATVTMITSGGNIPANVTWNVAACSYNPAARIGQTFTVSGTATLPSGVVNTNSVPLTVLVSVTVRAAGSGGTPGGGGSSGRSSGGGGCDAGLGALGLLIALSLVARRNPK